MARKIVITSGKGGVGKTTVTAHLAYALSYSGERIVALDVDFGLNNLDVVMGLENYVIYDMSDILDGRCRIKQALVQDPNRKNLYILPSGKLETGTRITGQNIKLMIDCLNDTFDFILIDCPAGIDVGFHRAVSFADEALVVATPNITSLRDSDKVISILRSYKLDKINLVVNRARGDLMLDDKMMYPKEIQELLKTDLIGVLPEEDHMFLNNGSCSLPKNSESYKAYKVLSQNIIKGTKKVFDVTNKYTGLIGSLRRSLKRSI